MEVIALFKSNITVCNCKDVNGDPSNCYPEKYPCMDIPDKYLGFCSKDYKSNLRLMNATMGVSHEKGKCECDQVRALEAFEW